MIETCYHGLMIKTRHLRLTIKTTRLVPNDGDRLTRADDCDGLAQVDGQDDLVYGKTAWPRPTTRRPSPGRRTRQLDLG